MRSASCSPDVLTMWTPAVNHSIPDLINQLGMAVLSEDGIAMVGGEYPNLRVMNQWTWHSRLYRARTDVMCHPHLELVELNSFGCGLDAVVTDQVQEIMHQRGQSTLSQDRSEFEPGRVRIRLRSLKAAIEERGERREAQSRSSIRRRSSRKR